MPSRPPRPCAHPGCREVVSSGCRCAAHRVTETRRQKRPDPFYISTRWRRLRALVLRASPLCALCGAVATLVDHIVPIKAGGADLDPKNLRSMCASCHAKLPEHGYNSEERGAV